MRSSLGTFKDVRLDRRGGVILESMVARKTVCLRQLGGDRAGELDAGRFFRNPKVTTAAILASWSQLTGAACAGRHVLAIQDTTDVKFPTTAQRRRGLGQVKKGRSYGVVVHAMLAADATSGACLGLVGGDVWNREAPIATPSHERPLEERESMRWLDTAARAKEVLRDAAMVTVIDDREGDIYAKWARLPGENFHLLTRASSDRSLAGGGRLFDAAAGWAVAGRRAVELPARQPDRARRTAKVEIRFGEVVIRRPKNEADRTLPEMVTLRLVEAREVDPPDGVEPLHWRLLTTHAIADVAMAWRVVDWYRWRWIIEQLFRLMKTQGLRLEDSQMTTAEGLLKLAAAATKAACVDLQLVQERDGKHESPASTVFTAPEIETLRALSAVLEGATQRQRNPHPAESLAAACWVIARLGGWTCYYKPPGPITMRLGMERFNAHHRGSRLQMLLNRDVRLP